MRDAEVSLDTMDLKCRAKFLDEDSYMILLIHHITLKTKKVKLILANLQAIDDELKKAKKQTDDRHKLEEEDDSDFSFKKHKLFVDSIGDSLASLNEKYNGKNGTFNLSTATRINTFSLVYSLPEIKSKYALVANILYLIEVQFKTISTKFHLTKDDKIEYTQLIAALEKGFKTHY